MVIPFTRSLWICLLIISRGLGDEVPCQAAWFTESASVQAGKVLKTGIRMEMRPGWHVYWLNPGESGLPVEVEWVLPQGWKVKGPEFLTPVRFKTGELHGFGYEGVCWFPAAVEVPADFREEVVLMAKLSWLACHEGACVPGQAQLELRLRPGELAATPEAQAIEAAFAMTPVSAPESMVLEVVDRGRSLDLRVAGIPASATRPELWPVTPDVIDPKSPLVLSPLARQAAHGVVAGKSEYAEGPLPPLVFWLTPSPGQRPWILQWSPPAKP